MENDASIGNVFIKSSIEEFDNLPPLPLDEQKIVDLLAGLMVDKYFAIIENKGGIKK